MNQISHYQGAEVQDAMAVVAKWMGKNNNLRVNYHNGTAVSADIFNGVINIPRLACSSGLTDEALSLLRGRTYHEAGHIAETELEKKDYPKGVLFEILNAIEDRRMERKVGNDYPGAKMVFNENAHYYNRKIAGDVADGKVNAPLWEALVAMSFQSEAIPPKWRLSEKAQHYFDAGYNTFCKWKGLADAYGSLELAVELFNVLKEAHEEYKQQQQHQDSQSEESEQGEEQSQSQGQGQGQGESDGEESESTGSPTDFDNEDESGKPQSGENCDADEDEDSESESGSNADDEEDGEEGENNASGSESDDEADEDAPGSQDGSEAPENGSKSKYDTNYETPKNADSKQSDSDSEAEMEEEIEGGKQLDEYQDADIEKAFEELDPADTEYLSRRDLDEHNLIKGTDADKITFKKDREAVAVAVASMVRALEQAMRARTRCRKLPYERTGKIDKTRLTQIAKSLSKEVFYRTRKGEKLETAVEIIIDESGSMSGNECLQVRRVAIAVGEALNQLHIPFEITGSTTKFGGGDRNIAPLNGLSRTNPIVYDHFKTFDQQWVAVCHNMSRTRSYMHNVDGEVVEYAARRLLSRPEERKVVLVLSDGLPDAGHGNGAVMGRNITRTSNRARKSGVEVYAFGIGTEEPKRFYGKENFIYLPTGEGLGPKFASEVARIISGGRFNV